MLSLPSLAAAPALDRVVRGVLSVWPQHRPFIERHFESCDADRIAFLEELATRLSALVGDGLQTFAEDYKWMCSFFLKYELQYRRTKGLEYNDFASIRARYYDSREQMDRYMRGLMLSQVMWRQHAGAAAFFVQRFLPALKDDYDYLEIGPGHGLWLSFAATDPRCRSLTGWDVAESSLALTRTGLTEMGVTRLPTLELQDVCAAPPAAGRFDAVVISQVLELVSSPALALAHLAAALRPGGLLFVNCPTRLLAPDHIRVWSSHAEIDGLLADTGLAKVAGDLIFPDAGGTPDKHGYSYVAWARKP